MSTRHLSSLLPVFLLLACSAAEPPPPAVTVLPPAVASSVAAPVVTAVASAAPAAPEGICAPILAHNRELLARPETPDFPRNDNEEEPFDLATAPCLVTPKGAWGLRIDRWEKKDKAQTGDFLDLVGSFSVVHLPEGVASQEKAPRATRLGGGLNEAIRLRQPILFDYDGDGEPELLLFSGSAQHEGPRTTHSALYTWKNGVVKLYPGLPAGVMDSKDVDHDGRPDFLYYPYSEQRTSACSGFDFQWDGPAHLAHSLPDGTFSLSDKAVRDHLDQSCPRPPKGKIKPVQGDFCENCPDKDCNRCPDLTEPPEACARLHGASEQEARKVLTQICKKPKNTEQMCQPPSGVCGDYQERESLLGSLKPSPAMGQGKRTGSALAVTPR